MHRHLTRGWEQSVASSFLHATKEREHVLNNDQDTTLPVAVDRAFIAEGSRILRMLCQAPTVVPVTEHLCLCVRRMRSTRAPAFRRMSRDGGGEC